MRCTTKDAWKGAACLRGGMLPALLLAAFLLLGCLLVGCGTQGKQGTDAKPDEGGGTATPVASAVVPVSYEEICEVIDSVSSQSLSSTATTDGGGVMLSADAQVDVSSASGETAKDASNSAAATAGGSSGDHTTTNVQVEGIDEGDVVKTDGKAIYRVDGDDVVISTVKGAQVVEVARIVVGTAARNDPIVVLQDSAGAAGGDAASASADAASDASSGSSGEAGGDADSATSGATASSAAGASADDGAGSSSDSRAATGDAAADADADLGTDADMYRYIQDLSISESTLAVICSTEYYDASSEDSGFGMYLGGSMRTEALLYDVADLSSPALVAVFGQDGSFNTSRMMDGVLYLASNYYVQNTDLGLAKPAGYVPQLYLDDVARYVQPENCCMLPSVETAVYTVMASYDLGAAQVVDEQAILGSCDTLYMSASNLYIAEASHRDEAGEPYADEVYTVVDHWMGTTTYITSFALDAGQIVLGATGTVDGELLNQFSLDEYEGHLRVVTTSQAGTYRVYTDEKRGFTNYDYDDDAFVQTNALYVLDGALAVVGSIEGLATDEQVYSVRFDGPVGYFVTFRSIDPLFAVDLADPSAPAVTSYLKIPGFSTYLHVYGEGRLLGLGRDANESTGIAGNMKLSLFDVSNPFDVTERSTMAVSSRWSEALYDHRALLVSQADNLIGFPVEKGYAIYGYSDDGGFVERASVAVDASAQYVRGLRIGAYVFVVWDGGVKAFDAKTLAAVDATTAASTTGATDAASATDAAGTVATPASAEAATAAS